MKPNNHVTGSPNLDIPPMVDSQHAEPETIAISDTEAKSELHRPSIPHSVSYGPSSPTNIAGSLSKRSRIKRHVSDDVVVSTPGHISRSLSSKQNVEVDSKSMSRRGPESSESKPKIAISKFTLFEGSKEDVTHMKIAEEFASPSRQGRKKKSFASSLSGFTKSWDTSRSPSPRNRQAADEGFRNSNSYNATLHSSPEKKNAARGDGGYATMPPTKLGPNGKLPRRPLSAFLGRTSSKPSMPSTLPIPRSFSSDRLPSVLHTHPSVSLLAGPRSISSVRVHQQGPEPPRKRDELWSTFRNLDADFHRFQSRSISSRTGIVRSGLLQFLRTHADHPSNACLKPDDLDRRANVLNRWWMGMLEILNGRNGESVSGNDRAVILEAITAIMIRPEWDSATHSSSMISESSSRPVLKSRSTTSLTSNGSDFFAESVVHNIRNTFSQNLLAQMAFVIEKMSARNAAPSVVTFCGKAIAYAFFYCDGVAEILVRLWEIKSDTLRRILAEYNVQRYTKLQNPSENVIVRYPLCLHALAFKSLPRTMRYLRSQPQLPIATAYLPWRGPWVRRWAGKDNDLLFAFTKTFHNLTCRLLPEGHSLEDRISAPGYILVQAQILSVLDANLQYDSNQASFDRVKGPLPMTFDDILGKPDATATLLPHPASSGIRSMAENRLIILLRDCLSRVPSADEKSRRVFAESFEKLLKATARRTSLFDHNACFILCDFMEEAIAILARYHQMSDPIVADIEWAFWLDVLKRMGKSQNTMTEIRLYSFLYSLWGTITTDETRKREVCLEWLLNEEVFYSQFNHWCPMVRAYFMRLVCWRVARCDSKATDLDKKILEILSARLGEVWSIFLYLKESSKISHTLSPSTAPCSPAPGRCLLIVRDDLHPSTGGMFLSFDSMLSEPSRTQATAYERYGSLSSVAHTDSTHPNRLNGGEKKRWSSLRSILPFASSLGDRSQVPPTHSSCSDDRESQHFPATQPSEQGKQVRTDKKNDLAFKGDSGSAETIQNIPANSYNSHSFKFSLEWNEREGNIVEGSLNPPKLPATAQMILRPAEAIRLEYSPRVLTGAATEFSKYTGRALSEWDLIVKECQMFFERRKNEGVPTNYKVETPSLGVELFKKIA